MSGSLPVFVHADDPVLRLVLVDALVSQARVTVVDRVEEASWNVVATSRRGCQLSPREAAVLRLVASGHNSAEIGAQLGYSERSVKNTIRAVTDRLALRNRCHAAAHAIRAGWI